MSLNFQQKNGQSHIVKTEQYALVFKIHSLYHLHHGQNHVGLGVEP